MSVYRTIGPLVVDRILFDKINVSNQRVICIQSGHIFDFGIILPSLF